MKSSPLKWLVGVVLHSAQLSVITKITTVCATAMVCLSASQALAQWRDVGSVKSFSQPVSSQCSYRAVINDTSQPNAAFSRSIEFNDIYRYAGPSQSGAFVTSTMMRVEIFGRSVSSFNFLGLMQEAHVVDVLDEVNEDASANFVLHLQAGNNFVLITPTWKGVDHGDIWLDESKIRIQKKCN